MSLPMSNDPPKSECCGGSLLTWLALVIAALGVFGTIWLSLGMKLIPCPLCYYQRTFVMSAFGVLAAGMLSPLRSSPLITLLALPLALAGVTVAADHVQREGRGLLECPLGILELGTAPQQSLALLAALSVVLILEMLRRRQELGLASLVGAVVLGGCLGFASTKSAAPPAIPPAPEPLIGCRPPAK